MTTRLLIDADIAIYKATTANEVSINWEGDLWTLHCDLAKVKCDIDDFVENIKEQTKADEVTMCISHQNNFRKMLNPSYKANRKATRKPICFVPAKKYVMENYHYEIQPWLEADDVIGTMCKMAEKKGFLTYMMTPDKDYAQLVSKNSFIYKPGRGGAPAQILGVAEVQEKFSVNDPLQVIDILGLWGDASDNIPGIPGIGEKTSKLLVAKYGSVEGIIENVEELKGKQKENVIEFGAQGLLSKKLATIITNVDMAFEEDKLKVKPIDKEKLKAAFTALDFRTLGKRVFGEEIEITEAPANSPKEKSSKKDVSQLDLFGAQSLIEEKEPIPTSSFKTLATEGARYHLVNTREEREKLINLLKKQKEVCFDTETDNLEARHANLVGISFSFKEKEAYYIPIPEVDDFAKSLIHQFAVVFLDPKILKIGHNLKYDLKVLNRYGINVESGCFDTMIAHYLINPESKQSMDFLAEQYLNYKFLD